MRWLIRAVLVTLGVAALIVVRAQHPRQARAAVRPVTAAVQPSDGTMIIPVAGIRREQLRPTFLDARTGHVHHALDILAPRGTPVFAAVSGTVRKLFTSAAGGLTIYEFDDGERRVYYYAHLDRYADGLHEGMRVSSGTVIGYVGTTGNAPANTPHLHFAIEELTPEKRWWQGTAIDPYPLLMEHGVTVEPATAAASSR